VKYFEYTGGQTLVVSYRGPDTGNNWVNIPDGALKSGNQPSALARMAGSNENAESNEPGKLKARIYPNPIRSHDPIILNAEEVDPDPVHISLHDMMGELYYANTVESSALNEGTQILPTKQLSKGIYILSLRQGGHTVKKRIVVKE